MVEATRETPNATATRNSDEAWVVPDGDPGNGLTLLEAVAWVSGDEHIGALRVCPVLAEFATGMEPVDANQH